MITAYYAKDPAVEKWRDDPAIKEYFARAKRYFDGADSAGGGASVHWAIVEMATCPEDLVLPERVLRLAGPGATKTGR